MRRGWTMVEFLVVVTVILVVASLVYPLARGMRKVALKQACMNNLRQIGGALVAYREEWDGVGKYGLPWEMGLTSFRDYTVFPRGTFRECPAGQDGYLTYVDMMPVGARAYEGRDRMWWEHEIWRESAWLRHVKKMKERSILYYCEVHDEPKGYPEGYALRYVVGLLLNGEAIERKGFGNPYNYRFWED